LTLINLTISALFSKVSGMLFLKHIVICSPHGYISKCRLTLPSSFAVKPHGTLPLFFFFSLTILSVITLMAESIKFLASVFDSFFQKLTFPSVFAIFQGLCIIKNNSYTLEDGVFHQNIRNYTYVQCHSVFTNLQARECMCNIFIRGLLTTANYKKRSILILILDKIITFEPLIC
jgi:hypothetical protein